MRRSIASLAFIALSAMPSAATILYVNAATGVDGGACASSPTPCKTVTYAMAQAVPGSPGDEIQVAPGMHGTALGETFPIVVKSGVRLKATSGAGSTILDASGAGRRVLELVNSNADTLVEGFTITGGQPQDFTEYSHYGGGMTIDGGSPTIRGNIFVNNLARGGLFGSQLGRGGAIHVANATPFIVNNVFRGNRALGQTGCCLGARYPHNGVPGTGGAIYLEGTGGTISNNTFYRNAAIGSDGSQTATPSVFGVGGSASHGAVYSNGASVTNNIFASNWAEGGRAAAGTGAQASASFGALQALNPATPVSNNLLLSNLANGAPSTDDTIGTASVCTGTACSGVYFHGEPSDLHITPQSPAAGAGTAAGAPATDLDGVVRPSPPSIGAFEPSAATDPVRPVNISTRMKVLTGDDVMIGGFVIYGSMPKTVVVRARGPSLAQAGISSFLADPTLQLFTGQTAIAANDNWQEAGNSAQILASGFAPGHPDESAILVSLPPGGYTAIVSGAGSTTGVGLVEVFEVDNIISPLVNIATRGRVQTGDDVMIAGFIIQGTGAQTVVVRARGPSLSQAGITGFLANPVLQLYSGQTQIAANDDWQLAANRAQIRTSGFAPSDRNESAILVTLNPGAYTAIVSGSGGTTGVAIVEVFKN